MSLLLSSTSCLEKRKIVFLFGLMTREVPSIKWITVLPFLKTLSLSNALLPEKSTLNITVGCPKILVPPIIFALGLDLVLFVPIFNWNSI